MGLADKRQQMMFAHRIERDAFQDHHLIVVLGERRRHVFGRVLIESLKELHIHFGYALRGVAKTLSLWIFADPLKYHFNRRPDLGFVHQSPPLSKAATYSS